MVINTVHQIQARDSSTMSNCISYVLGYIAGVWEARGQVASTNAWASFLKPSKCARM